MNVSRRECCICAAEADWACVRKPNAGQLDYLCDRHYQALRARNTVLAARYDCIAALSPLGMDREETRAS